MASSLSEFDYPHSSYGPHRVLCFRTTGSDPSQISEIEDLSHRVHAHIRFALNGFVPINQRLPPEVLGIIPSFLIHDRDRILATHVCRHWRTAFLSTPSLWNNIDTFEHPEKTKVYLERSGDTPLNISISSDKLWKPGASASLRMLRPLPNRCRTVRFLQNQAASDVFDIIQNPCPHLVELYLEMPNGTRFHGIDDLGKLPSLTSLTLIGNMRHLRFSQPFNLRKLGVGYNKSRFRLESLLELLEKIPLLEEFEFHTPTGAPHFVDPPDARSPVVLKHLQRIVFRGVRSEFPLTLCSLITYPSHTRVILTYHLSYDTLISLPSIHPHRMFPYGMRLSTSSPPKSIRYQEVQDDDLLETRCYIDLISLDGHHISIENRHGWPHKSLLQETKSSTLEGIQIQCFEFLCTLNLSFVERFCIQQSNPDPGALEEVTGYMPNLRTLITVNGYPYGVFMGLEVHEPENVWCPLLRRLVVRQDLEVYSMHWHMLLPIIHDRAARGFPLEQVILTSSFNELPEEPEVLIQELERTVEVTYDLGRNTFGWEWWNV